MKRVTITIKKPQESYDIVIGNDLIKNLQKYIKFSEYTKVVLITDDNVWRSWQQVIETALPLNTPHIILPPGEQAKNIDSLQIIWKKLLDIGCDRKSLIINFGGGVIGDIGGFAASTYMRGIDFINIPSTLLSQIDASVGGKTGFDFVGIKNLIGTFNQPNAVFIDVQTLTTLPKREFISGFAEIIKTGLIFDKDFFETVTSKNPSEFSESELIKIIEKSCDLKSTIVQMDEKENGKRKLLNFGHTIGHAIESISLETDKPLLHGEAVSIGMVAEAKIAKEIGLFTQEEATIIKEKLQNAGLPITLPNFSTESIIKKMKSDKKNSGGHINFTLLKKIGDAIINQTVDEEVIKKILNNVSMEQ